MAQQSGERDRATDAPTNSLVPARSIRQSERPLVKLGIRIFGYDRLLRWFKQIKSLRGHAMAAFHRPSQQILKRRTALISDLQEASQPTPKKATARPADSTRQHVADLKIALLIPSFQMAKGGAEKVAGRLANLLVSSGSDVHIFCRPPAAAGPPYAVDERVVIRHGIETNDAHVTQLSGERFDVLIGFGMPGFYARIPEIARRLDVPFIIQECNNPDYIARSLLGTHGCFTKEDGYWLRQAVFSHAAGVRLTVPHYELSIEPGAQPFVHAFYNALSTVREAGDAPKNKFIAVGAMKNAKKNGLAVVQAFCEFSAQHPHWSLHLYGENNFRAETQRLMQMHKQAAIVDHGVVDDIDEIYGDAYALLIPSYDEGLPNVVVEAFSYGVPAIGFSDCSGVKHLIGDGKTGLLLDRTEPHALEQALQRISDKAFRDELSSNALSFARENLETATWERNWLALITHAASNLDANGTARLPAAYDLTSPQAPRWRELLQTYLHFPS